MRLFRSVVRWSVLAVAALALGACATQPRDEVELSVGTQSLGNAKARDYAALYAPYAMMATAAYTNTNALTKADRCPDIRKLGTHLEGDSDEQFTFNKTVRGWIIDLNNWLRSVAGHRLLRCQRHRARAQHPGARRRPRL